MVPWISLWCLGFPEAFHGCFVLLLRNPVNHSSFFVFNHSYDSSLKVLDTTLEDFCISNMKAQEIF